jgi:hypothetical protein
VKPEPCAPESRQKPPGPDDFLTWLPVDPRTGKALDGRGHDARQLKARLQAYAADLTRGKRALTTGGWGTPAGKP